MDLCIEHISKRFKDMTAVDDISLSLTPGVWGLLGANGAGKTTLMRMLAGIMQPTSGQITYDGIPISTLGQRYRDIFGYLPQEFGFYPEFTVQDYLEYVAVLKGLTAADSKRKINELLEQLTLTHVRRKKIAKLSGGMKRRVGIAQALLNEPEVLILVGVAGLEPAASWSRTKRATSCATPRQPSYYICNPPACQALFFCPAPFPSASFSAASRIHSPIDPV